MHWFRIILFFLLLLIPIYSYSSGTSNIKSKNIKGKEDKALLSETNYYFDHGMYSFALDGYMKLYIRYPEELFIKYRIGMLYLALDEYEEAEKLLKEVFEARPKTTDLTFFLGNAYHLNNKFDLAIEMFNLHLKEGIDKKRKSFTLRLIQFCENGKKMVASPVEAKIKNIGNPVNTEEDEYVPVISSDESVLIFTYRGYKSTGGMMDAYHIPDAMYGEFYEDIFITHKDSAGSWKEPESIGPNINGLDHDACIAISNDGQKLFVYRHSKKDKGDIFISYLNGDSWGELERLKGGINSKYWEGSVSLSADEKTLYFCSERSGGLGGKDLYTAERMPNGSWGNIKNMGPEINTPFDEDAPFIHPDGRTLYYSSNGLNSMGGFDIFYTELVQNKWTAPVNIGYPINTADDDIYYVLSADGTRGYYASGKTGGLGKKDIYIVETPNKRVLMLVKGTVTVDDEPVFADIIVKEGKKEYSTFNSNETNGKYLFNLPKGSEFQIIYKVKGFEDKIEYVSTVQLDSFTERIIDVAFYTEAVVQKEPEPEKITEEGPLTFDQILEKFGDTPVEGLVYKVQVGAYKRPKNFTYAHLKDLGNIETLILEDNITRFTLGTFNTLRAAESMKDKVLAKGGLTTDSFVTAIYKGRRVYLIDLVRSGFVLE